MPQHKWQNAVHPVQGDKSVCPFFGGEQTAKVSTEANAQI
jgi:hypothetical protein